MITYRIQGKLHLLIAEEGLCLKQIELDHSLDQAEVKQQVSLPSKQEIRIVLSIQPISHCKAILCIRNSKMLILNLLNLTTITQIDLPPFRLIKHLPTQSNLFGMASLS